MVESAVSAVIALAKAGIECCHAAKVCKSEVARIGERLTFLVVRSRDWRAMVSRGPAGKASLDRLISAMENVYVCVEAASLPSRRSWRQKLSSRLQSKDLLTSILESEGLLNTAIADFQMEQSNAIFSKLQDVSMGVAVILDQFGQQPSGVNSKTTMQEEFESVLEEFYEAPELTSADVLNGSKTVFAPTEEDLREITLDRRQLRFDDSPNNLLGGGGFADVYIGEYQGRRVAVKRIKLEKRDIEHLSKREIHRDIERVASEALLTHQCSKHPNVVEVIGCIAELSAIERPMIVMELMSTTLFDALRSSTRKQALAYSRLLYLLDGVAGALEFLHLQGIVHHDVKSLNILLNNEYTVAKLSDFGEAKVKGLNTTKLRRGTIMSTALPDGPGFVAGTVAYQAPEILCEQVRETSRVSEMYSFGVTVWECLTGKIPHAGKKEANIAIFAATKTNLPMLNVPSFAPTKLHGLNKLSWQAMRDVSELCLSRDRKKRPNASRVVRMWRGVVAQLQVAPIPVKPPQPNMELSDHHHVRRNTLPTQPLTVAPSNGAHSNRLESQSERLAPVIPIATSVTPIHVSVPQGTSPSHWQLQQPQSQPFSSSLQRPPPPPYSPPQPYVQQQQQQQQQAGGPPTPYKNTPPTIQEEGGNGRSNGCVNKKCLIIGSIVGVVVLIVIIVGAAVAAGGGGSDDGSAEPPAGTPNSSPTTVETLPPSGDCEASQSAFLTCTNSLSDFGVGCAGCLVDLIDANAESETCGEYTNGFCDTMTRSECKCDDCLDVTRVWYNCVLESPTCVGNCKAETEKGISTSPPTTLSTPAPTSDDVCPEEQADYVQCLLALPSGTSCQNCVVEIWNGLTEIDTCSEYDRAFCRSVDSCQCGQCLEPITTWMNCFFGVPGCVDC